MNRSQRMKPPPRRHWTAVIGTLLIALFLVTPTAPVDAREGEPVTALLCFISADGNESPPLPPGELRGMLGSALTVAFTERGFEFCSDKEIETLLLKRRVRSFRNISTALLDDLTTHCGAERLLIGQLRFFPGKLIVSCRTVDPITGRLNWLDLAELQRNDEAAASDEIGLELAETIAAAAGKLAVAWREPPRHDLDHMIVLPSTIHAGARAQAGLLDDCLLRVMLAEECWWLPEPSLVVTWLAERGQRPRNVHGATRRELGARFLNAPLLHVQLLSYGDPSPGRRAMDQFTMETPQRMFTYPLYCTAQMVNNRSGRVLRAGECYLEGETPPGLFGLPKSHSWTRRFAMLAEELHGSIPYHHEVD